MSFWKSIRMRWMYWRYRHITRNRQRFAARRATRGGSRPIFDVAHRGLVPVGPATQGRTARTWILLFITVAVMALVHEWISGQDIIFILDIAILAAAYMTWTRITV